MKWRLLLAVILWLQTNEGFQINHCNHNCNQPASVGAVPAQMPVLPLSPENRPGSNCNLPLWNLKLKQNLVRFSGMKRKPKPYFKLIVKRTKKGYVPGKQYDIIIKGKVPMTGFYVTLHNTSNPSCSLGSFIGSRLRRAGEPKVDPGCNQPLVMEGSAPTRKSTRAKWIAPVGCDNLGEVEIRAEVRDEEYLYQDNETERPEYQKLIRVIRPRIKKKRRRH